ncbi:ribosomal protein L7/L12 [Nannocystis pusilla]|uniref:ribosomal protein L7/L12 n=1 Tax=Nannocystis pusilla TaxID=889268 RepID=UPI003B832390
MAVAAPRGRARGPRGGFPPPAPPTRVGSPGDRRRHPRARAPRRDHRGHSPSPRPPRRHAPRRPRRDRGPPLGVHAGVRPRALGLRGGDRSTAAQRAKIAAIKRFREVHGVGLKEAKDAVDARAEALARRR